MKNLIGEWREIHRCLTLLRNRGNVRELKTYMT